MADISKIDLLSVNGVNYHLPAGQADVINLVNDAKERNEVICVRGAAHSFPLINTLEQGPVSKPIRNYKYLMLSKMNNVVIAGDTVTVDAGCHLGFDPFDPSGISTEENSLTYKLFKAGWAFDDLGGISHQTVGGFLSTGSSGGSTQFAFEDNLISVDVIICGSNGAEKVTYSRPVPDNPNDPFYAVGMASIGLMGVIVSATFKCIPTFTIEGSETTSKCDECEIDLFGSGKGIKFKDFLEQTQYSRTVWWPQKHVTKAVVWKAKRQNPTPPDFTRKPYQEVPWVAGSAIPVTVGADILFTAMGNWPDWLETLQAKNSAKYWEIRAGVELLFKPVIFPLMCKVFVGDGVKTFWDYWYSGLPMDNQMGDKIMPVWFTELWIPIEQSQSVLNTMKTYYEGETGCERTGKFTVEIYAAKKSPFWLSPAYGNDVIRIDIFWFANNAGGDRAAPITYYQQFWDLLRPYKFRPHWAKYFPDPVATPEWSGYLESVYDKDKWARWRNLRAQNDPGMIFLNDYWRSRLEIE